MRWINLGARRVDLQDHRVSTGASLTPLERDLLLYLAQRPEQVVPRGELLEQVWGYAPDVNSRAVDKTINRLRKKLEPDPNDPRFLRSEHGRGYSLHPASSSGLLGREREIEAAHRVLERGEALALGGLPGVGKTALAMALAKLWSGETAWVSLPEDITLLALVPTLHAQLGVLPAPHGDLETALRRPKLLLVLDDVTRVVQGLPALMRRWQVAAPSLRIVLCTRVAIGGPGLHYLEVPPLQPHSAQALFITRAQQAGSENVDPETVRRLLQVSGTLPLVVRLLAAALSFLSLEALERRVGSLELDLPAPGRSHTLRGVLELTWKRLDPDLAKALPLMARLPGGFTLDLLDALVPDQNAARMLALLRQSSLVFRSPGDARLRLHPTVQHFTIQRGQLEPIAHRQFAEAFLEYAERFHHGIHGPEAVASLQGLREQRLNLLALLDHFPDLAPRVSELLQVVYKTAESLSDWAALNARAAAAAQTPLDRCRSALHQASQAIAATDPVLAMTYVQRSLSACPPHQARAEQSLALLRRAYLWDLEGKHAAAQADLDQAERLAQGCSEFVQAQVQADQALHHFRQGRPDQAEPTFRAAIARLDALGDGLQRGVSCLNFGLLLQSQGRFDAAAEQFAEAASIGKSHAFLRLHGLSTTALLNVSTPKEAKLDAVADLAGRLGSVELASLVAWWRGYTRHLAGDLVGAKQAYEEAERLTRTPSVVPELVALRSLGGLLRRLLALESGASPPSDGRPHFWSWQPGRPSPEVQHWPDPSEAARLVALIQAINARRS